MNCIVGKHLYKHIVIWLLIVLSNNTSYCQHNNDALFLQIKAKIDTHQQLTSSEINKSVEYYNTLADTAQVIRIKKLIIGYFASSGRYQEAYDFAWSLLPLLETEKYATDKLDISLRLAGLYILFEQYEHAKQHIDSCELHVNSQIKNDSVRKRYLAKCYSKRAWLCAKTKRYTEAEELLLTRYQILDTLAINKWERRYTRIQLSELYLDMYRVDEAGELLKELTSVVPSANISPHILINSNLGRYYFMKSQLDSAIFYSQRAVIGIDSLQVFLDKKIDLEELIARCYQAKSDYRNALLHYTTSKNLSDSLFGSKSALNKELFSIKDKYALRLTEQENTLNNQRIALLENEQELSFYKLIAFVGIALVLVILLLVYFTKQRQRLQQEKRTLQQEQALKERTQSEMLEMKNKELMTASLQMLERDSVLEELDKHISALAEGAAPEAINTMLTTLKNNKSKKWEEFQVHFTSVHSHFYDKLRLSFPKLTATDLKICAFLKLGFTTKEIAELLGIGPDSVNTSRSRIRKKMNLGREVNIVEYLQCIELE